MQIGVYPASVTPFDEKGAVDLPGIARLYAWFATNGCSGVVLAATNGEGPSLSAGEKRDLIKFAVPMGEKLGIETILGIATPSLDEANWLCKQAHQAGANGVLLMPPSYFREASPEGVETWLSAVIQRSPVDVLVYNFPRRTGVEISAATLARLSELDHFAGVKDSSGETANLAAYKEAVGCKLLYIGDETLLTAALDAGWSGTISGVANVMPLWLSQVVGGYPSESASAKYDLIRPSIKALRSLPQPAANKVILKEIGVMDSGAMRLPLLPANRETVLAAAEDVLALLQTS